MLPSLRSFTALVSLFALIACGGGGGGDGIRRSQADDALPSLSAATFIPAAFAPSGNDSLQLLMSEDASLATGELLTDLDITLSSGSLGSVTQPPTLLNARTALIELGPGASLNPGLTTIAFAVGNDVVLDTTNNLAIPNTPRLISLGDGDNPAIQNLTLNGIDNFLNGNGAAGGTLQVPEHSFTIDIAHSDPSSPMDVSQFIITASIAVGVDGDFRQPGVNLADAFVPTTSPSATSFLIPTNVTFQDGLTNLSAYAVDSTGMISSMASFTFLVRTATDAVLPFEATTNPSQVWYLDLSRDIESYSINVFDFVTPVRVHAGANSVADIEDLFIALGLLSSSPIPNLSGSLNSNEVVMNWYRSLVLQELNNFYDNTNVTFTFTSPGTFPGGASSLPYASQSFSQICIAGAEDPSGSSGTFGVAIFDPLNRNQNNNCLLNFNGTQRLGVFLHTIINQGFLSHPATTFRATYDPFTPSRFGNPVGDFIDDDRRVLGTLIDGRTSQMSIALIRIARFTAVIAAHECGHSVGLVANGPVPTGLFGNDSANFPVFPASAADGHINMPSALFPGVSVNVMSPTFTFDSTLAPETDFNTLNRAYLRQQVVINGN